LGAGRSQQVDQHRRHRLHGRRLPFARARHLRDEAGIGRHRAEHRPVFAQAMHQAVEGGQRHLVVARPRPHDQHAGLGFGHRIEQPALARARLAGHDEQPLGGPGAGELGQLGGTADQLRWAQRRRGQGLAGQPGVCMRLLDGLQQRHRLGRRPGSDFVLERLFAVVEGEQRGRPVAPQVVQAHHVAVRRFAQAIEPQQGLCHRQRGRQLTGAFQGAHLALQVAAHAVDAALALAAQPGVERRRIGKLQLAEHTFGIGQVMFHTVGQTQGRGAGHQLAALPFQMEEPLAQRVARCHRVALRPQQLGQLRARGRSFERQPGQQGGIARRERTARAIGARGQREVGEFKVHRCLGGGTRGARTAAVGVWLRSYPRGRRPLSVDAHGGWDLPMVRRGVGADAVVSGAAL
jgi:hypothetical protein